jgi:hypothetical protein
MLGEDFVEIAIIRFFDYHLAIIGGIGKTFLRFLLTFDPFCNHHEL